MKFIGLTNFNSKTTIYLNVAHIIAICDINIPNSGGKKITQIYTTEDGSDSSFWSVEESVSDIIKLLNEVDP